MVHRQTGPPKCGGPEGIRALWEGRGRHAECPGSFPVSRVSRPGPCGCLCTKESCRGREGEPRTGIKG